MTTLTSLPHEILLHITSYLNSTNDLNSTARLNSKFYTLLNQPLYRHDAQNNSSRALFWAALQNRVSTAQKSVEAGANLHATTEADGYIKGCTALLLASARGHLSVLEYLLKQDDVNPNARDRKYFRPPLAWAVKEGHIFVVQALLSDDRVDANLQDKMGDTPLMIAAKHQPDLITTLLYRGANPRITNGQGATPLSRVSRNRDGEVGHLLASHLELILDGDDSGSHVQHVFFYAAIMGHTEIVRYLVFAHGAKLDPNGNDQMYGMGAFSLSAWSRRVEVLRYLLSWDATDPNLREPWKHQTPLFVAAMHGHEEIVDVLLESEKVDLEIPDVYGTTPLGVAADKNHEGIVRRLISGKRRVNLNARNANGQTPLFTAAFYGHEAVVTMLLDADGIDAKIPDADGKTPLDVATENGNYGVLEILRKHIANAS